MYNEQVTKKLGFALGLGIEK